MRGIGVVPISRQGGTLEAAATGGWWDNFGAIAGCWGAWQAKGATSFAASLADQTGNGRHLVDPGGAATPAWAVGVGWTFDGIANYLVTTFVCDADQTQSGIAQFAAWNGLAFDFLFGQWDGGGATRRFGVAPDWGGGNAHYMNQNEQNGAAAVAAAGNLAVAGAQGYYNGIADGIPLAAGASAMLWPVYVGCWNNNGAPAGFFGGNIVALALYERTLTAPEVATVAAAMAAL